ncbi:MAG: radical SAM protein [Planctomycetota bacterium]
MELPSKQKIDREIDNQVALATDMGTRSLVWQSRPTALEFSYNNLCNLKCIMCAKSDGEPNSVLNTDIGNTFLEETLPHVLDWTPSANSEPLLNNVDPIQRQAEQHEVWLHLISNGTLLTPERYEKVRKRLHRLWISLDAATPPTFEKVRVNARWDQVMENLRQVVPKAIADGVEVTFNFVLMSINWHEAADFVGMVADLGGLVCNIQELLPNSTRFHELAWEGKVSEEEIVAELERAREMAEQRTVDLKVELRPPLHGHFGYSSSHFELTVPLPGLRGIFGHALNRRHPGFCSMASSYLKVTPDGNAFPCCRGPESLRMGNIKDEPFEKIWNGEKFQSFRKRMFEGKYPAVCASCYVLVGNPEYQRMTAAEKST